MQLNNTAALCAALIVPLAVGGCASTAPTNLYVLQPIDQVVPAGYAADDSSGSVLPAGRALDDATGLAVIGVGPIELPHYLDRPQVVTRGTGNKLEVSEFAQWGEPLKDNVTRVLADNIATLLPADDVVLFPWKRAVEIDYQVTVEVSRFDGALGEDSVLVARWQVVEEETGRNLVTQRSRFAMPSPSADHEGAIAAMNASLDALSAEITQALRRVTKT